MSKFAYAVGQQVVVWGQGGLGNTDYIGTVVEQVRLMENGRHAYLVQPEGSNPPLFEVEVYIRPFTETDTAYVDTLLDEQEREQQEGWDERLDAIQRDGESHYAAKYGER